MTVKQVIVIRKDLKMRRGKEIAQGSHASMMFIVKRLLFGDNIDWTEAQGEWLNGSFAKVCLQVDSLEELMTVYNSTIAEKLEVHLITDAGFTEFKGEPTVTCLAIGPDKSENIDKVTGHLRLY